MKSKGWKGALNVELILHMHFILLLMGNVAGYILNCKS